MFLIVVFIAVLAIFFLVARARGTKTLDALHRAIVAAILSTLLALIIAIATSYI